MCEPSVAGVLCVASRSTPRVALRICLFARRRAKRARVDSLKGRHATRRCVRTEARRRVTTSEKPVRAESARHRDLCGSVPRDVIGGGHEGTSGFWQKHSTGHFSSLFWVQRGREIGTIFVTAGWQVASANRRHVTPDQFITLLVFWLEQTTPAHSLTHQLTPKFTKRPRWPTFPRARSPRPPSCCT